jgi:hypothetical protein
MPGLSGVLQFTGLPVNRIDFLRLQLRQLLFVERIIALSNPIADIVCE